jgi:hypothetical protein
MTDGADPARIAMFAETVHVHALALETDDEVIGHVVATGGTGIETEIAIGTGIETEIAIGIGIGIVIGIVGHI